MSASDSASALADALAAADDAERSRLLAAHLAELDIAVAEHLKAIYDTWESSNPTRALAAADALSAMASVANSRHVQALADWTSGLAALDRGDLDTALRLLTVAEAGYLSLGREHDAARTLVARLIVLAITGRYDEATDIGQRARELFVAHGDLLSAAKIEQNLGNIAARQERHADSEQYFRDARERYQSLGDERSLAQIENNLATALKWQHRLREASELYSSARDRAAATGQEVTQAEIECNLGILSLFQGRYDAGLAAIEQALRRYTTLDMAQRVTITELELADAWLDLNLIPEAVEIYERIVPALDRLGAGAEAARGWLNLGRGLTALERYDEAAVALATSRERYAKETNPAGIALVDLAAAKLAAHVGDYTRSASLAEAAIGPLAASGVPRRTMHARWLLAVARRRLGASDAESLLRDVLDDAERDAFPEIIHACYTELGLLAVERGAPADAVAAFERAINVIEALRAPLPSEDLRAAFIADKLTPFHEMVRIHLNDGTPEGVIAALHAVERARARALLDIVGGALDVRGRTDDPAEAEMRRQIEELREELSWLYSQINRPPDAGEIGSRGGELAATWQLDARERERRVAELSRRLLQRVSATGQFTPAELQVELLSELLGPHRALVEYASLDGELLAFVVTNDGVAVVQSLCTEASATALVDRFRFQIGALRNGAERMRGHLPQLTRRAVSHLRELYDLLLRPLESLIGTRDLMVVPHRALHYVPFQALHDGAEFVIERRAVSTAPSAALLARCIATPARPIERTLLVGVPDDRAPRVRDEVIALAETFPGALTLLETQATRVALREAVAGADLIHLACHGLFRPDNPLFSALRLADGWLTVREIDELHLRAELVTLSACETGVSQIAPGDELLGIARGFLSSGTPALVVSLWTVDDDATQRLMHLFYERLRSGAGPAASLRAAQVELLREEPHPFFWAAFNVIGRPS